MIKKLRVISLFLIIAGCSTSSSNVIEKVDTVPIETEKEPALIEQHEEEEMEQYIEFFLDDEQVLVNLQMVPILKEYLSGSKHRQSAINDMKLDRLPLEDHQIYLLEFSCFHDSCSYLLFNQSGNNAAYLIADLAKSKNILISPDQSKVAIQFSRNGKQNLELDNIVVIDLIEWKVLSLNNETSEDNFLNYTWPYVGVQWMDDETLTVSVPDIIEPTSQHISEWNEVGGNVIINTYLTERR
ncbi:hypothetical protein [Oceanobacillus saliphilus]|uniref:hypothetical protein n=1 Tax=Oceanobacillus saliphilus TaxID=2925834 RepID=UPI00201E6919|nr:hypothetical protein [Oceanobacillus saliphilus]